VDGAYGWNGRNKAYIRSFGKETYWKDPLVKPRRWEEEVSVDFRSFVKIGDEWK
jgi:hypothetical protein